MEKNSPPIELKYSDISNMAFAQALQKIASTPTSNPRTACRIRKIVRAVSNAREKIQTEFKRDIMEIYKGPTPEGESPDEFHPDMARVKDFEIAQKAFGERIAKLDTWPITIDLLTDVKVSAAELESMKGLFSEEESQIQAGPGLPSNVANLR